MPFDGTNYETAPVTQMLMDGRERVERGWSRGVMRTGSSVCMIGSLTAVVIDYELFTKAEKLMREAILNLGYSYRSVADFNDALYRTKEQVLEVYDMAIELSVTATQPRWKKRDTYTDGFATLGDGSETAMALALVELTTPKSIFTVESARPHLG